LVPGWVWLLIPALAFNTTLAGAPPANDMFANRIVITGTNTTVTGSNIGATKQAGEPNHAGNIGGASVWWSWQAPRSGSATISTMGSPLDTLLGVYTGSTVAALTLVASNDDDSDAGGLTSKVVFDAISNQTYQIAVDGYSGAVSNLQLKVQLLPPTPLPPAPAWSLSDPYGEIISSTNYCGKVVVLDFWATWCGPCKAGMPDLVALQEKYGPDGLVIVGVNVSWSGDSLSAVQDFLSSWSPTINYPTVISMSSLEQALGGIGAIPTTFIIDRNNLIRKKYVGTQSYTTLENQIVPLLYANKQLCCSRTGNQLNFRWPTHVLDFTIETTTNLLAPNWTVLSVTPNVVNGTNTVLVPMTNAPRYFRLRLSY
jgi:thiol-disulfide isomerase/thioredoxin